VDISWNVHFLAESGRVIFRVTPGTARAAGEYYYLAVTCY